MFKPQEISIVDDVLREVCFNHTAASISLASHDDIWKLAEIGEEIPLETAIVSELAEITEDADLLIQFTFLLRRWLLRSTPLGLQPFQPRD
jgi:hypothetical protein